MASEKRLRKAAAQFRRYDPALWGAVANLIQPMAQYIQKTGAAEVTVGTHGRTFYFETNGKTDSKHQATEGE